MLSHIGVKARTPALCRLVCQHNGEALAHVPATVLKDHPELYEIACTNNGMALQFIEPAARSLALCQAAVTSCAKALTLVPETHRSAELYRLACRKSGAALQYIDSTERTDELCQLAINAERQSQLAFPYLAARMITQDLCERVCHDYIIYLEHIPAHLNPWPLYRSAIAKLGAHALWHIPRKHRTAALCAEALERGVAAVTSEIPVEHWNLDLFVLAIPSGRWDPALLKWAKEVLPGHDYLFLLTLCAVQNGTVQLQMLTSPSLSSLTKVVLVSFLVTGQTPFMPGRPYCFGDLQSEQGSLCWARFNRGSYPLLTACYQHPTYEPPLNQAGRAVEEYIAEQLRTFRSCLQLPIMEQVDLGHAGEQVGGRTVKVDEADCVVYYKFQKEKEELTTLVREGLVHRYREQHPDSPMARLASDLPGDPLFFELDEQNWPADVDEWPDAPKKLSRPDGSRFINIYRYRASADYSRYAHQPDSDAIDPWQKPEAGILAACHDMGLFAAHGLPLTSMSPAFHDSDSGRSWLVLHSLLGYKPFGVLPGTFGAWNTVATEFCDLGYSGLRDVGDFEPFAAIDSLFDKEDVSQQAQPVAVGQKLAFVNTICENLLAAILVRSRLRQCSPDYHFENDKAVSETATFIHDVCRQFLRGMGEGVPDLLPTVLNVDNSTVQTWLDRSAREILYWTAAQPNYHSPETPAFAKDDRPWDHADCYALHLRHTGRLSPKLYSHEQICAHKHYPEDFHNVNMHLNLGANNTVFPLISLVKGFIQLGTGLLLTGNGYKKTEQHLGV